ncbi:MAG TPA: hypothetical protein DCZ94_20940 [Lentisphaeria bacterium]|nr:hypothetical protein [Lentisphaeria bacterium]
MLFLLILIYQLRVKYYAFNLKSKNVFFKLAMGKIRQMDVEKSAFNVYCLCLSTTGKADA